MDAVGSMTGKTLQIQVQDDHLARIAQTRKPILALAELIWNAVDADATHIDVTLIENDLNGLKAIEVSDDGHGISYAEADELFSRLGGSWKRSRLYSIEKKRILHGKEGRGRFRAFSLGRVVDWDVRAADSSGALQRYRISMIKDHLRRVEISDAAPVADRTGRGVTVTVSEPEKELGAALLRRGVFALFMGLFARGCVSPVLISGGQQPSQRVPASFRRPAEPRNGTEYRRSVPLGRAPFWTFARRSGTVPWAGGQTCDGCDDRIPGT